jgi:hypothetical protein
MRYANVVSSLLMVTAVAVTSCNRSEPAREAAAEDRAATELRDRNSEAAELEKRVIDIETRWTEMEAKVKDEARTPTTALRTEVKEDVTNARQAVTNLKTTSPDNWWERHEQATERTVDDIAADVRRFAKAKVPAAPEIKAEPVGTTASFDERRNQFVASLRARVDAMEEQLKDVKADGAAQTELEDTRARIDKLQDDLDRLRTVSPNEWWQVSRERVSEYLDRLERSIRRLDDDKAE